MPELGNLHAATLLIANALSLSLFVLTL